MGDKYVFPSLDIKINKTPQQLLLPESKISVSWAEGKARVLVGDHPAVASSGVGWGASRGHTGTHAHIHMGRPLKLRETYFGPGPFLRAGGVPTWLGTVGLPTDASAPVGASCPR